MTWTPTEWTMSPEPPDNIPPVTICRVRGRTGVRYAIRQAGACMDANGEWEIEPIPSSRTDEWLDRFRYDTLEAAKAAAETHCTTYGRFLSYAPAKERIVWTSFGADPDLKPGSLTQEDRGWKPEDDER